MPPYIILTIVNILWDLHTKNALLPRKPGRIKKRIVTYNKGLASTDRNTKITLPFTAPCLVKKSYAVVTPHIV